MTDPDDSMDLTKGSLVSIMKQLRSDGRGTLPRANRASLGSLGGPVRPRPVPKPHPRNPDDQE